MREDSDLGQLGAFSRNRAPASFSTLDRSNTGSAKNTPKSDMDLLACIQHLASLNWASHRMAARSLTRRAPGPSARSWMSVGIFLSPLCCFLCVAEARRWVQTLLACCAVVEIRVGHQRGDRSDAPAQSTAVAARPRR